ncbi:MAG: DUF1553 domain-containing protein, partial [Isosphaeraceae bacterium]
VQARIAAEQARLANPPSPQADLLGRLAAAAERRAVLLQAEVALAAAEAELGDAESALKARPNDAAVQKRATSARAKKTTAAKAVETARTTLAQDDAAYTRLAPSYPATSTGRRLALARWIVSSRNPLAARVAVNHVWLRHFGAPLVPTVAEFGLNGKPPTHPALLDWLAVEFVERGWSLKSLNRLIVTSNAYRMSSVPDPDSAGAANVARDPANLNLWRMNPRRMEAESVRDNVLAAAGTLSGAMGGPDLDPDTGLTDRHRSLYFRHTKEKRVTFLRLFDSPSVTSCYRRTESVVPQQALALANSSLTRQQASILAARVAADPGAPATDDQFLIAVFERVLGRLPSLQERRACQDYLRQGADARKARESLVHVLFNHSDFVTIR